MCHMECENVSAIERLVQKHGTKVLANVCSLTPPAIYKWLNAGRLPRTEWTGETNYAELISEFDPSFSKEDLLAVKRRG